MCFSGTLEPEINNLKNVTLSGVEVDMQIKAKRPSTALRLTLLK
ncbi:MAG: hypothetical protein K0S32_732 [Bacteroidetes bacterium]|jgi:hypothetical protein|nr:hypothetical protein [Bacteroidota bacterium]